MAHHIAVLFDSSSDEEELIAMPPALPPIQEEGDNCNK